MASTMLPNQYGVQPIAYGYATPQPPPSPPVDEASKCSLPSISNLLGLADQGSPTSETARDIMKPEVQSPISKPPSRPTSSHYQNSQVVSGKANALPPTPPMGSEASFDGYNSPSTKSISHVSVSSAPNYYFEATPPMESVQTDFQRQQHSNHQPQQNQHQNMVTQVPRVPIQTQYSHPHHFASPAPYMAQPPLASYYHPMQPSAAQSHVSALYYQRPLPQQFPPLAVSVPLGPSAGPNPWQHHHYISPSSTAAFTQSQERYICQTCTKAFSRPSSLRIHSHSHTGEKPFKCPHPGCGKAFSVRSNMKRHERGCHNYDTTKAS